MIGLPGKVAGPWASIVTAADHGEFCNDAMGFIFDFGFAKVYYSGDTCYNLKVLKNDKDPLRYQLFFKEKYLK